MWEVWKSSESKGERIKLINTIQDSRDLNTIVYF